MAAIEGLMQSSPERPFNFNGRWIQLAEAFFNLPGASIPPLYIASIAPRMLALTELHGDGWLPFGLTPPIYAEFLKKLQPRSPEFTAGIWIPTFAEAKGEDRNAEAEASGKLYLSMAPQVLEAALGRGEAFGAQPTTSWTPGQAAEVRERIPRELALASTLHGSPNQIVEQLEAFRAAGCRCFVLRITDPKRRRDDARLLAERVMTVVRG
jgi:alkanesulfonate monooxygenase SsuD/methylene tetrahydromethanopterin reductase-like flavin-dependent oxidoreductase (luciferase family)